MSELKTHKTFEHTLSFDVSQNLKGLRQSTRNNSDNTSLMIEDLTDHTSLNKSVTLEEIPIIICDWLPCNFTSKERATLIKHIDEHIGPNIVLNDGLNDVDHHMIVDDIVNSMVDDVQQKVSKGMGNEKSKTEDISSTNLGIAEKSVLPNKVIDEEISVVASVASNKDVR